MADTIKIKIVRIRPNTRHPNARRGPIGVRSHPQFRHIQISPVLTTTVLLARRLDIVAPSQAAAIDLNAIVGKDENEHHEQYRYQQDLFKASAQLIDHFPHMRHQNEDPQRPQAPYKHQNVRWAVHSHILGHQEQKKETAEVDEEVNDAAEVLYERVGREEETVGARLQRDLDAHADDKEVVAHLQLPVVHDLICGTLERHAHARDYGHEDHEPVEIVDQTHEFVKLLVLLVERGLLRVAVRRFRLRVPRVHDHFAEFTQVALASDGEQGFVEIRMVLLEVVFHLVALQLGLEPLVLEHFEIHVAGTVAVREGHLVGGAHAHVLALGDEGVDELLLQELWCRVGAHVVLELVAHGYGSVVFI